MFVNLNPSQIILLSNIIYFTVLNDINIHNYTLKKIKRVKYYLGGENVHANVKNSLHIIGMRKCEKVCVPLK